MKLDLTSDMPRYALLKNAIIEDINSGKYRRGDFLPAERSLCQELEISRDTVRRAFEELEKEGYLVREPGTKRPVIGHVATNTPSTNSSIVAYITRVPLEKKLDGVYSDLANVYICIAADLIAESLGVVYLNPVQMGITTTELMRRVASSGYGGVIYFPGSGTIRDDELAELKRMSCPVVVVEGYPTESINSLNTVELDNYHGGQLAARYLLENGHRKIVHLTYDQGLKWIADRERGFVDALKEAGASCDVLRAKRVRPPGVLYEPVVYPDLESVLAQTLDSEPTAVFAVTDLLASDLINYAARNNVSVPDDISVVGFDNINVDEATASLLSSVSHMTIDLAAKACDVLVKQIKSASVDFIYREQIRPVMVIRSSVVRIND